MTRRSPAAASRLAARGILVLLGLVVAGVVPVGAAPVGTVPPGFDYSFRELVPVPTTPDGLPGGAEAGAVGLVLDDGTAEGTFGVGGATARQFLWFQVFDAPSDFDLEEIHVLFPEDPQIVPGAIIELVVYQDDDLDPSSGTELLRSIQDVVQVADGTTFSVYPLLERLEFRGGGQILIGVVNRFTLSGVDPPTQPAALDTSAPQGRSWVATWTGDPPEPPTLPPDESLFPVDDLTPGNWMIRGFGTAAPAVDVPSLGGAGLLLLACLVGLVALARLRPR